MAQIEYILQELIYCIKNDTYKELETDSIEIKNMPPNKGHNSFDEILKSTCAFLNTNGGKIIVGIKEKQNPKRYELIGYDDNFENTIKLAFEKYFRNDNDEVFNLLPEYIYLEKRSFLEKFILIIHVDQLDELHKYVFYNGLAYRRILTGDHLIEKRILEAHKEYKIEMMDARELFPVKDVTIDNFNIEKLNEYITYLNSKVKIETLKTDIENSISFLKRKKFIDNNDIPTTLGYLVIGKHPGDYLLGRAGVDCYLTFGSDLIAGDKLIIRDNLIQLLLESNKFVLRNTKIALNAKEGGSSEPEYPDKLIRESINNSLAHRDYSNIKPVIINIIPNKHIEIKNPGTFKTDLIVNTDDSIPIKRIIPNQKPVNPRLSDVLKVFDKFEGKGIGMATLTNECLDNKIDLPYYKFHKTNEISLFISSGKLLDDFIENILFLKNKYIFNKNYKRELDQNQKIIIAYLLKSELENKKMNYTILLTGDNNHSDSLNSLLNSTIIEKHPKSPENYPVYILDREIVKTEYTSELLKIFGSSYENLNNLSKDCLNLIYQMNNFSFEDKVSANIISNILLSKQNSIDFKESDNFKRRIRLLINKLDKEGFIFKETENKFKPGYKINEKFQQQFKLF